MARQVRKSVMKEVPHSEVKDDLSRYLRQSEQGPVVIMRHRKAAGVVIGVETEEDCFEFRLQIDRTLLARIAEARTYVSAGPGTRLENVGRDD
jgi:PHD/YefM family antitoxin component YafN of YafNO toxin-antitoxin module